ncbi:hypothetical protein BCR42DRAFT_405491 [Absidia repens]|uniref:Histone deacetylase interacting domain-containing protein n=1 Tax=Absidia repens TaxID=90262 RepID=A0A1X2ITL1_9FUNG|nr:hypothetical protein BCR42DRAFT_405491 [Absidia repens]
MVVMSERAHITTRATSIHLQDLEFEKKLKALIQKIRALYHTPEKTLRKLSLIISRNQHTSSPTINILQQLNRLSVYDAGLISYITKELALLFPRDQNGEDNTANSNMRTTSTPLGNAGIKQATLALDKNQMAKCDGSDTRYRSSKHDEVDNNTPDHSTRNNKLKVETISNNRSSGNISDNCEDCGNDKSIESNVRWTFDMSDIRSAPIRRRPSTRMTLESESLQEILQHGDPKLADDIYQHIGQHTTFQSFLELLNMYDTHLIDHMELLQRLVPFLGRNKPLFDRFKLNLMYDRMDNSDNLNEQTLDEHAVLSPSASHLDPSIRNNMNDTDAASASSTVSSVTLTSSNPTATRTTIFSPSYRWIPKSLRNENCPGRDDTCWEVLNDEYVSHPTWASEDNGFLSSNKSKSEEMLHMVEDERYALDIDICVISDVLSMMENYLKQIMEKPISQRPKMNLSPENDGCSTALYTLAIRKVYPRERRKEAARQLHNRPYEMLPGFVKLMKQKQMDLQKQKLDKIRNWKDTVAKHYYKFLDYQWENLKSEARKNLTIHNLVNEIDALWHEQQRQAILHQQRTQSRLLLHAATTPNIPISPISSTEPTLSPPQLVYIIDDSLVLYDVISLMRISSNQQLQHNTKNAKAIDRFLSDYLPFFLGLPLDSRLDGHDAPVSDTEKAIDEDIAVVKTRSQGHHHHSRRHHIDSQRHAQQLITLEQRVFIGNTNWYCMTRYFQMIYASLAHMKSIDQQYQKSPKETKRNISAPLDLALDSKSVSSVTVDLTQGYYAPALEIMKAFIRGDLEQIDLEEGIRYIFGVQAYVSFNIGKTLPHLIRQVQQIMTNSNLDGLFNTFKKYQPCRLQDMHTVLEYRYEVDNILEADDNRFIMAMDGRARQLSLQILGQHEAILPKQIRNYIDYVTSFQQRKRKTVGVKRKTMNKVFLNRNLEPDDDRAPSKIFLQSDSKCKINPRTYRMYFTEETEDVFIRQVIPTKKRKSGGRDGDGDNESP